MYTRMCVYLCVCVCISVCVSPRHAGKAVSRQAQELLTRRRVALMQHVKPQVGLCLCVYIKHTRTHAHTKYRSVYVPPLFYEKDAEFKKNDDSLSHKYLCVPVCVCVCVLACVVDRTKHRPSSGCRG